MTTATLGRYLGFLVLITSFFLARFFAVYNSAAGYDFADTSSYFLFKLDDPIRMPLITFIYSNIIYFGGITLIQSFFSSISWILLALSVYFFLPRVKWIGFMLILSLGVTTPIVELDTLLLSESFTISSLVLLIGSLLYYLKSKSIFSLLTHLFTIVLFAQFKQSSLYLALLWLGIFSILFFLEKKTARDKIIYVLVFSLSVIFLLNLLKITGENLLHNRQLSSTVIIEKSFFDKDLRNYWFSQGYPPDAFLVYAGPPFDIPIQMVRALPTVKAWENKTEPNPSLRIFLDKPLFPILAPIYPEYFISRYGYINSIFPPLASGTQYVKSQVFRDGRDIDVKSDWITEWNLPYLPWWSDEFQVQKVILILMAIVFILYALLNSKFTNLLTGSNTYLTLLTLWLLAGAWANWLTAAYKYERYLMPSSVGLRILFALSLTLLLSYGLPHATHILRKKNSSTQPAK